MIKKGNWLYTILCAASIVFGLGLYFFGTTKTLAMNNRPTYGVSFTKSLAVSLGEDWQSVYTGMLDDLKIRKIRIGLNWDEIEKEPGHFDFLDYDWMVREATKRHAKIVFVVGRKLIRWPECRVPTWAKNLDENAQNEKILSLIRAVIDHYKSDSTVSVWQVENEPFFAHFGVGCPKPNREFLKREIALARALDPSRSLMVTASGELSSWLDAATVHADMLGISMYRYVWNVHFGFFKYPFPSWLYNMKGRIASWFTPRIIISELQAEPWAPNGFLTLRPAEEARTMSHDILHESLEFARQSGYDEMYLWGVEWWHYKKEHGDNFYWEEVKQVNTYTQ